jgi:hypothetical protein
MELDETRVSCFRSGAESKSTFSLEIRPLYFGILERGYNVPPKTYLEEIQLTIYSRYYSACFSRREDISRTEATTHGLFNQHRNRFSQVPS